jgi:phage shock protein A
MSTRAGSGTDPRPAEQRAEELMERVVSDGSRIARKVFGRVREEVEDIVAEARAMNDRSRKPRRGADSR